MDFVNIVITQEGNYQLIFTDNQEGRTAIIEPRVLFAALSNAHAQPAESAGGDEEDTIKT